MSGRVIDTSNILKYFVGWMHTFNGSQPDKEDIADKYNIYLIQDITDDFYFQIWKKDDKYAVRRTSKAETGNKPVIEIDNIYIERGLEKHLDLIKSKIKEIENGN